jgi:hypothetical protein
VTPSREAPATDPELWSPVPDRPYVQAAARLGADPDAVQAELDEFDATLRRRAAQRRAATRDLVAELYARDRMEVSEERLDAETERLAAELRRLVAPGVAAVRRARTLADRELEGDCQAALGVLATAPRSLAEFQPEAEQRYAAEQASLDGFATREAEVAGQLGEARGWQPRRRQLRRELAEAGRGRQAAAHRVRAAAARLAAVQLREAQRAEWLAQPKVQEVLGAGAAALRELADRAQASDATAELPAIDRPVARGAAR